jgi:hypothetical protein
LRNQLLS